MKKPALMLAFASTIMMFLALHALVYFIEAGNTPGKGPIWLPPPTSLVMLAVPALISVLVGHLVYRHNRNKFPDPEWKPQLIFAVAVAVLVGGGLFVGAKVQERDFLETMNANDSNHDYLLSEGRQACEWLSSQHWGPPDNYVGFGSAPYGSHPRRATKTDLAWDEFAAKNRFRPTQSTSAYFEKYMKTGGAPNDGRVVLAAWYRMCPLQQFVHRPVGGNNNSGVGD